MGAGALCEHASWDHERNPLEGTERVRGVPKWPEATMRTLPLGHSAELPMGLRSA